MSFNNNTPGITKDIFCISRKIKAARNKQRAKQKGIIQKHLMRRMLLLAGVPVVGCYAYDTIEGGGKINRSTRAAYVAFATFVEYKFVLERTDQSLEQIHKRVAERWLWCVRQNGGLYSKLAQAVASMNHVLPPEYLET